VCVCVFTEPAERLAHNFCLADEISLTLFSYSRKKTNLFLSFRRVLNVIYSFLGNSPASEF